MNIELLTDTIDSMTEKARLDLYELAKEHGMAFAASATVSAIGHTLGLVLAMAQTEETRKNTLHGFSLIVSKSLKSNTAAIEAIEAIDRVRTK